jgi:hypothetical protein
VQKVLGNDSLDSIFDQMSLEDFLKVAFFSEFFFFFSTKASQLERRALLGLKCPMNAANRIAFEISKLQQKKAEELDGEKERLVSEMINQAATSPAHNANDNNSSPVAESKTTAVVETAVVEEEKNVEEAESWGVEEVVSHFQSQGVNEAIIAQLREKKVDSKSLFALGTREVDQICCGSLNDRRKVQYLIEKLKAPIEEKKKELEEKAKRLMKGKIVVQPLKEKGADPKMLSDMKNLTNGVLAHVSYSEKGVLFEIENTGKQVEFPRPIIAVLKISGHENVTVDAEEAKLFVVPNVEMKLQAQGGKVINKPASARAPVRVCLGMCKAVSFDAAYKLDFEIS